MTTRSSQVTHFLDLGVGSTGTSSDFHRNQFHRPLIFGVKSCGDVGELCAFFLSLRGGWRFVVLSEETNKSIFAHMQVVPFYCQS